MNRRDALQLLGLASIASLAPNALAALASAGAQQAKPTPTMNPISLAQWSLHRRFGLCSAAEMPTTVADAMDFPKFAKSEFGISRVEYVNAFYRARIGEKTLGAELKKRCDDLGVSSVLIMCDGEGICGAAEEKSREEFAANHEKWLALAKTLGCHSIRVNAIGEGTAEEQTKRCADGLTKLLVRAKRYGLGVIVENHGGLSSDGAWVIGVMKAVNDPMCGTLPDFGNWRDGSGVLHDPVRNVGLVAPYAKGMSAKSYDFNAAGDETVLDYPKIMEQVRAAKYTGAIGIEYEGKRLGEAEGIVATKKLLERLGCVA